MGPGIAAGILCFASGYLLVAILVPKFHACNVELRTSFSAGIGLGIFSGGYVVEKALGLDRPWLMALTIFGVMLAACLLLRSREPDSTMHSQRGQEKGNSTTHRIVGAAFVVSLVVALYSAILHCVVHPHGDGWDAFSIWDLHARFLFRGGSGWRDGFSALIPWSHPDYPLLLPAAVANFWSILGNESQIVPGTIGLVFTFSAVGLLFSSLDALRGRTRAMLGGLVLLATPFFIELGSSEYADVPLSFFYLAAIASLCLSARTSRENSGPRQRLLVLSGLAAGLSAWTKNEGLLFVFALLVSQLLWGARSFRGYIGKKLNDGSLQHSDRGLGPVLVPFLLGLAPALLLVFWFKHWIAPRGDLFPDISLAIHKMLEPGRYWIVIRWYAKSLLRFGGWWLVPGTLVLLVFHFLVRFQSTHRGKFRSYAEFTISLMTLSLTLAGYFAIYLITPYDLFWHLRNSLNRLFLQLWPSAIFLFFLAGSYAMQERAHSSRDP